PCNSVGLNRGGRNPTNSGPHGRAKGISLSACGFPFFEGTMMRQITRFLHRSGVLLVLLPLAASRADDAPQPFAAAPKGFDTRRDGIERGKVHSVEYDPKTIGGKGKMTVYTPPGYSKDHKYPVL